jgi:hypothetical protein
MSQPSSTEKPLRFRTEKLRKYVSDLCSREGMPFADVVEALAYVGITGRDPLEQKINELLGEESPYHPSKVHAVTKDGKFVRVGGLAALQLRLDCLRIAAPYMLPKLQSTQIADADGKSVFGDRSEAMEKVQKDPEVRALFEKIVMRAAAETPEED